MHANIQRALNIQTVGYTQASASIETNMSQVDTSFHNTMFCTCGSNTSMNSTQQAKKLTWRKHGFSLGLLYWVHDTKMNLPGTYMT